MEEILRELETSEALRSFLRGRIPRDADSPGCSPCCKWILEDLELNGRLTGYPRDYNGVPLYPIGAKLTHLHLELVGAVPAFLDDHRTLVAAILARLRAVVPAN